MLHAPLPSAPYHMEIDFTGIPKAQWTDIAAALAETATQNGIYYRPP